MKLERNTVLYLIIAIILGVVAYCKPEDMQHWGPWAIGSIMSFLAAMEAQGL